jgi:uncharacterized protein YaiI (UPF0178 family)
MTSFRAPSRSDLPVAGQSSGTITIYVDADACPVKNEVYRVAGRHGIKVIIVSNSPIAVPRDALVERVVVAAGLDEADNWIAGRIGAFSEKVDSGFPSENATTQKSGDIVITADIPLASRCVKAGAAVIAPNGRAFTDESIGMALATRNLMDSLRSAGEVTSGPKSFSPRDRSSFLSALDQAIVRLKRAGFG